VPKNLFTVEPDYDHAGEQAVGVIVANLGTPEAPTAKALRPYLGQFLWDPRVVEYSRPLWWLILNGIILTFRPKKSAKLYANVWTDAGSPLLTASRAITEGIGQRFAERFGTPVHCALGMTYGEPSMKSALDELKGKNCRRIVVLPLYPHYSSSTVGSVFDAVAKELMTWRWVPELRTINQYPDRPAYIDALVASARPWLEQPFDHVLFSYHGLPELHLKKADPTGSHCLKVADCCKVPSPAHASCYRHQVLRTTEAFVKASGLQEAQYSVAFQSRLGRAKWLEPATEQRIRELATSGIRKLLVLCPAFVTDCLETLEEIEIRGNEVFQEAGGKQLLLVPCLNSHPQWVDTLAGWID